MGRVKCEECKANGEDVWANICDMSMSTAMGWQAYYDDNNVYHNHNPNTHSTTMLCKYDHPNCYSYYAKCGAPDCEWDKKNLEDSKNEQ